MQWDAGGTKAASDLQGGTDHDGYEIDDLDPDAIEIHSATFSQRSSEIVRFGCALAFLRSVRFAGRKHVGRMDTGQCEPGVRQPWDDGERSVRAVVRVTPEIHDISDFEKVALGVTATVVATLTRCKPQRTTPELGP